MATVWCVGVCVLTIAIIDAAPARAHLDGGSGYSNKSADCSDSTIADPITAVMHGTGVGTQQRAQWFISEILGWKRRTFDDSRWFGDHDAFCEEHDVRGANHPVWDPFNGGVQKVNRWHVRGRFQGGHEMGHNWTVMTPHRDVWEDEYVARDGKMRCSGKAFFGVNPHG